MSVEKIDEFDDVIYTPHFRGERYLYHVCGGCGYKVEIEQKLFCKLHFDGDFKYCPNCGKPVVRFAQLPVFEEPPVSPAYFIALEEIFEQAEDRIDYYLYITLSDNERKELVEKARFARELQETGGPRLNVGAKIALEYGNNKLTHWDKKRLVERMKKTDET